jgi:hypothetical protein
MLKCNSQEYTQQLACTTTISHIGASSIEIITSHMPECKVLYKGHKTHATNCPAADLNSPTMK